MSNDNLPLGAEFDGLAPWNNPDEDLAEAVYQDIDIDAIHDDLLHSIVEHVADVCARHSTDERTHDILLDAKEYITENIYNEFFDTYGK